LGYIVNYLKNKNTEKQPLFQEQPLTVLKREQPIEAAQYTSFYDIPKPKPIDFSEKLNDDIITNMDELIEQQKTGPKTVEELQRAQLTVDEIMQSDIAAIKYAVLGGILTDENIQDLLEGTRTIAEITGRAGVDNVTTDSIRTESESLSKNFRVAVEDMIAKGDVGGAMKRLTEESIKAVGPLGEKATNLLSSASDQIKKELQEEGGIAGKASEKVGTLLDNLSLKLLELKPQLPIGAGGTTTEDKFWTNLTVEGMSGANKNLGTVADQVREQKSLIELLGEIKVNVNFQDMPTGLSSEQKEQITKTFSDKINEQRFKDYIVNVTTPSNAYKGGGGASY
jgi:hypothetical protein